MHPTCEHCHKNVATVHLTEIVDKVPRETHLCELCAQKLSVGSNKPLGFPGGPLAVAEGETVVSSLVEPVIENVSEGFQKLRCPVCGMSWNEFRVKGRMGCSHDYVVFEEGLIPLIERIQGASPPEHRGKLPSGSSLDLESGQRIRALTEELQQAVAEEAYERAAQIRDRIRELTEAVPEARDGEIDGEHDGEHEGEEKEGEKKEGEKERENDEEDSDGSP